MKEILRSHPEIKQLFGPDARIAKWTVALVAGQLALGACLANRPLWVIVLAAYLIGAVANHALWVVIHECAHRLVFRGAVGNRLLCLLANWPQIVPGGIPFCKYHLLHHAHQGEQDLDGDLATADEARWVGNSTLRKALLMLFFSFVQGTIRPAQLTRVRLWDGWFVANIISQLLFLCYYVQLAGWGAVLYLFASFVFSIGLHPLGGRWIAEHYLRHGLQETYSYYGPLNRLSFNVGYHNEHHDFMQVPWCRLPQVRAIASEYYDVLYSHPSWPEVLRRFILSPQSTLYDRIVRPAPRRGHRLEGPDVPRD